MPCLQKFVPTWNCKSSPAAFLDVTPRIYPCSSQIFELVLRFSKYQHFVEWSQPTIPTRVINSNCFFYNSFNVSHCPGVSSGTFLVLRFNSSTIWLWSWIFYFVQKGCKVNFFLWSLNTPFRSHVVMISSPKGLSWVRVTQVLPVPSDTLTIFTSTVVY